MTAWLGRIGDYICWETSAPKLSEPSKLWIRLADILRSGCRNIFRGGYSLSTKSCHGRKTWFSDAPIRSHHPEARPAISREALTKDEARRIAANIAKLPTFCAKLDGGTILTSGFL